VIPNFWMVVYVECRLGHRGQTPEPPPAVGAPSGGPGSGPGAHRPTPRCWRPKPYCWSDWKEWRPGRTRTRRGRPSRPGCSKIRGLVNCGALGNTTPFVHWGTGGENQELEVPCRNFRVQVSNTRPAGQMQPTMSFYAAPDGLIDIWSPLYCVLLFWRLQTKWICVIIIEKCSCVQYFYSRIN